MPQSKTLLTAAAYQKLKEQEKYWLEELKKIKKRYGQDVKGAGGGSASKDLAQEALRYATQRLLGIEEILQDAKSFKSRRLRILRINFGPRAFGFFDFL